MGTSKTICVLGNYSGRNAGDAAILGGLLREISTQFDSVQFLVPTVNPSFIESTYREYPVRPVNIAPWRGSLKLLGIQTWRAIRSSDLVLVTDAILFDRGLWNPLHNYLLPLAWLVPKARNRQIPVVLYNVSVGPITSAAGEWCLKRVLDHTDLVLVRDDESVRMLERVPPIAAPVLRGADSALSVSTWDPHEVKRMLQTAGVTDSGKARVGINVNAYGDAFLGDEQGRCSNKRMLAVLAAAAQWIRRELNAEIWLFGTQRMDLPLLRKLRSMISGDGGAYLFANDRYDFRQLTGLLAQLDLLIGMRTHALILASSAGTPVIGIVNYPKTSAYLKRIHQERCCLPLYELELSKLQALILDTWSNRAIIREEITRSVVEEKRLAWHAASFLQPYLT